MKTVQKFVIANVFHNYSFRL